MHSWALPGGGGTNLYSTDKHSEMFSKCQVHSTCRNVNNKMAPCTLSALIPSPEAWDLKLIWKDVIYTLSKAEIFTVANLVTLLRDGGVSCKSSLNSRLFHHSQISLNRAGLQACIIFLNPSCLEKQSESITGMADSASTKEIYYSNIVCLFLKNVHWKSCQKWILI